MIKKDAKPFANILTSVESLLDSQTNEISDVLGTSNETSKKPSKDGMEVRSSMEESDIEAKIDVNFLMESIRIKPKEHKITANKDQFSMSLNKSFVQPPRDLESTLSKESQKMTKNFDKMLELTAKRNSIHLQKTEEHITN